METELGNSEFGGHQGIHTTGREGRPFRRKVTVHVH